ncbi:hypothetical protein [Sorangium atrum]|uniref:Uncharacterized protein n=1 Tax=Sorangium atrum TaxID=2995308 RepID=A0ABT5C1H3_9BACT|nr:hypothetical protein [Sorangium aterium]MDC0680270.1 hypothetical protein [Sorangium aterium]
MKDENATSTAQKGATDDKSTTSAAKEDTRGDKDALDEQCWGFTMILAVQNKEGTETLYYEVPSDALTKKRYRRPADSVQSWCNDLVGMGAQIGHVAYEADPQQLVDMDARVGREKAPKVPVTSDFCGTYLVNLTGFRRR